MINFQQFSPEIRIENSKILPCLLDFFMVAKPDLFLNPV